MTDSKKTPGRPRLYESSSAKVGAFRSRIGQAGYSRKEVLVTQETASRLAEIAREEGVPVQDVASALLEYGLRVYEGTRSVKSTLGAAASAYSLISGALPARAPASGNADTASPASSPVTPEQDLRASSSEVGSPIQNFFQRRKDSINGKP